MIDVSLRPYLESQQAIGCDTTRFVPVSPSTGNNNSSNTSQISEYHSLVWLATGIRAFDDPTRVMHRCIACSIHQNHGYPNQTLPIFSAAINDFASPFPSQPNCPGFLGDKRSRPCLSVKVSGFGQPTEASRLKLQPRACAAFHDFPSTACQSSRKRAEQSTGAEGKFLEL